MKQTEPRAIAFVCLLVSGVFIGWAVTGCTTLPDIPLGICGNQVRDDGEFCDVDDDTCTDADDAESCWYECPQGQDSGCPVGLVCGADRLCRRASGSYHSRLDQSARFDATEGVLGDLDEDGTLDLLGVGPAGIHVAYGDGDGQFIDHTSVALQPFGGVALVSLIEQQPPALITNLAIGPVAFEATSERTLQAVPLSSVNDEVDANNPRVVGMRFGMEYLALPIAITEDGMCVSDLCELEIYTPLPNGLSVQGIAGRISTGDIAGGMLPFDEMVLGAVGRDRVWLYRSTPPDPSDPASVPTVGLIREVTLPGPALSEPRLVDVDRDGLLDMMVLVDTEMGEQIAIAYGQILPVVEDTLQSSAMVDSRFDGMVTGCGADSRWPLAAGVIDDTSATGLDFVIGAGICLWDGADEWYLAASPLAGRAFVDAVVGDFNGDGNADVAAVNADEPVIDMYLNTGSIVFNSYRIGTQQPATRLRVGDFDGNFIDDLAFVQELSQTGENRGENVSVVFGSADGILDEPVSMARVYNVQDLEPIHLNVPGVGAQFDAFSDLLTTTRVPGRRWQAFALFGNAARQMTSPVRILASTTIVSSLIGRYISNLSSEVMLTLSRLFFDGFGDVYRFDVLRDLDGFFGPDFDSGVEVSADIFNVEPECSLASSVDIAGTGTEQILLLEGVSAIRAPRCTSGLSEDDIPRLMLLDPEIEPSSLPAAVVLDEHRNPAQVVSGDIDADGQSEIIIRFEGSEQESVPASVVVFQTVDRTIDVESATILPLEQKPLSVAIVETVEVGVDDMMEPENKHVGHLAVLTTGSIRRYDADAALTGPGALVYKFTHEIDEDASAFLLAGDFNDDRLQDVVVVRNGALQVLLSEPMTADQYHGEEDE